MIRGAGQCFADARGERPDRLVIRSRDIDRDARHGWSHGDAGDGIRLARRGLRGLAFRGNVNNRVATYLRHASEPENPAIRACRKQLRFLLRDRRKRTSHGLRVRHAHKAGAALPLATTNGFDGYAGLPSREKQRATFRDPHAPRAGLECNGDRGNSAQRHYSGSGCSKEVPPHSVFLPSGRENA